MPTPLVRALRAGNPGQLVLLVFALLLILVALPFLADHAPILGLAAGAERQAEPARCMAIGNNWTACGNAAVSDDGYAAADSAAIRHVRSGGATGTSFPFDVGSPGTDRLVVVIADDESTGTSLTAVTVDARSCSLVTVADNPAGAGNHQEMWHCDEDDLGSSNGLVTVAIVGGDLGWAVHAHLYIGASQSGPTDIEIEDTVVGAGTIEVEFVTVPAGGVVVFGAAHGAGGSFVSWTPPLLERTDGPDPASAVLATASEVESSPQSNKTYIATLSGSFNRGTGIVAVWPSQTAKNDTAWLDFGLGLGPQDTVNRVEVGVEWYRLDARSILSVTVSWDGGSTWAPNQTATNKSVDDDTVEFLNFTSATAWDPVGLTDANLRVRVGTNHSGARMDYLILRVNYNAVPVFSPVLSLDRSDAERGDVVLAILYYNNTGSGPALRAWANWSLNDHYELMDIFPAQTYSPSPQGFDISFADLVPGSHSLVVRLRVIRGLEDGLAMEVGVVWSATDGNGNSLPDAMRTGAVSLHAPSLTASLGSSGTSVQVGSEFVLDATVLNVGRAVGEGWLNLTLPPGVLYVSSDGPFQVTATADLISWRIASLNPGTRVQIEVWLRAEQGPSLESFVLSVDFTDGKGSAPLTEFSNEVFVRLFGTGPLPVPWWIFLLPLFIPAAFFGFYLNRRLRHPELRIEEVFVIHRKGILVAHQSRTLTPDRDRDILAAMFKAVQGFVQNAFSADVEGTMRGLRFENFNVLIEQGTSHYVAVVYQGHESRLLERRVAELSQSIEREFGALLASWVGDMSEIRGIRQLLPLIWGETSAFATEGPEPIARAARPLPSMRPRVRWESLPGKLIWWLPLPVRLGRRIFTGTSSLFRELIRAKENAPEKARELVRDAWDALVGFVRGGDAGSPPLGA